MSVALSEEFKTALIEAVGSESCLFGIESLVVYECDALTLHHATPSAVVFPRDRDQVIQIVKACRKFEVSFVPRGAGTGLSGGALAEDGGVIIECSRMDRILEINGEDRYAVIEPGVVNATLSKTAEQEGLSFAPDPSSQLVCTIGGNIAENSGGPHTFKHGSTTGHVLALEVVLPDGELLRVGSETGIVNGLDLVGLFVGSEGTLGVVTQATVRLTPLPEKVETLLAIFSDLISSCRAVGKIIEAGLVPAAMEIIDRRTIEAVEASVYAAGLPQDAGAVLLIELDGPAPGLTRQVDHIQGLVRESGASSVEVARDEAERLRFWKARKGAFGAMGRVAPDLYVHDAVVPRAKLPEVLEEVCAIGDRYGLVLSNVFHAGDGNIHPNISFDRRNPDELERVLAAGEEILRYCVRVGGVISGEHGIGREKRDFMGLIFSVEDLALMTGIRDIFDPENQCNPGKVLPTSRSCVESNPKLRALAEEATD